MFLGVLSDDMPSQTKNLIPTNLFTRQYRKGLKFPARIKKVVFWSSSRVVFCCLTIEKWMFLKFSKLLNIHFFFISIENHICPRYPQSTGKIEKYEKKLDEFYGNYDSQIQTHTNIFKKYVSFELWKLVIFVLFIVQDKIY